MATATTTKRSPIVIGAEELIAVWEKWKAGPDEFVTVALADAVMSCLAGAAEVSVQETIPATSTQLLVSCCRLADEMDEFDRSDRPQPRGEFWEAIQSVRDALAIAREERPAPVLESVQTLASQGVYPHQIAQIWGITQDQVHQELQQAGSVVNEQLIADRNRGRNTQRVSDLDQTSLTMLQRKAHEMLDAAEEKQPPAPCPETPEELWKQGVMVPQAARMLHPDKPELDREPIVGDQWAEFEAEKRKRDRGIEDTGADIDQASRQADHQPPPELAHSSLPCVDRILAGEEVGSRDELVEICQGLGITVHGNAKDETLRDKIRTKGQEASHAD